MDFKNEIVLNGQFGPNGLALNQDVESSVRRGLELSGELHLNNSWSLSTSAAWSHNTIVDKGEEFEPILSPDWIVNQKITYQADSFELGLGLRLQSKSYLDFANTTRLGAYAVANLFLAYSWKNMKLRVYLNNLTDKQYFGNGLVDYDGTAKYFIAAPLNAGATIRLIF